MSDTFFFITDEFHIAPNLNLVNFKDLNRILKSEIFLHRDGQLRAVHVILKFTPISKCFQSLKHVINAKDPRLALIDVVVPRFLTEPPHQVFRTPNYPISLWPHFFTPKKRQSLLTRSRRNQPQSLLMLIRRKTLKCSTKLILANPLSPVLSPKLPFKSILTKRLLIFQRG